MYTHTEFRMQVTVSEACSVVNVFCRLLSVNVCVASFINTEAFLVKGCEMSL